MSKITPELSLELEQAISGVRWTVDYPGGPAGMIGSFQGAIRKCAARKYAAEYAEEHGKVPEGYHEVSIKLGPPGSDSDFEHAWVKSRETESYAMFYPNAPKGSEDPDKQIALPEQHPIEEESFYLGRCEVTERPFHSEMREVWIERTGNPDQYEIIMSDEINEANPDGTDTHSEGFFTADKAAEFLSGLGIEVDEEEWSAITRSRGYHQS
jgi:hypothetical protein